MCTTGTTDATSSTQATCQHNALTLPERLSTSKTYLGRPGRDDCRKRQLGSDATLQLLVATLDGDCGSQSHGECSERTHRVSDAAIELASSCATCRYPVTHGLDESASRTPRVPQRDAQAHARFYKNVVNAARATATRGHVQMDTVAADDDATESTTCKSSASAPDSYATV